MQPLNQEIVNDHTKDFGHHDRQLHGQTAAHGQGDRMKALLTRALVAHGGLSRWREIEAFQLKVSIGGGLWRLEFAALFRGIPVAPLGGRLRARPAIVS